MCDYRNTWLPSFTLILQSKNDNTDIELPLTEYWLRKYCLVEAPRYGRNKSKGSKFEAIDPSSPIHGYIRARFRYYELWVMGRPQLHCGTLILLRIQNGSLWIDIAACTAPTKESMLGRAASVEYWRHKKTKSGLEDIDLTAPTQALYHNQVWIVGALCYGPTTLPPHHSNSMKITERMTVTWRCCLLHSA